MWDLSVVDFNDGNHTATILASLIIDTGDNYLDGNGDGSGGDDYIYDFHQLLGDFDNSQNVDFIDYSLFANKWQDVNCVEPCWCGGAGCGPDGVVDNNDLTAFAEHWIDSF
ncbi:MAG: hypothetical protein JXA81_03950 [Sedimentisphaerales bacterium]|nr:hypothetical protein [Sedimentisphaerales bacterium]